MAPQPDTRIVPPEEKGYELNLIDTFSPRVPYIGDMPEHNLEIGSDVAFFGGRGQVVDLNSGDQKDIAKILTSSGELRLIPTNIESLSRV